MLSTRSRCVDTSGVGVACAWKNGVLFLSVVGHIFSVSSKSEEHGDCLVVRACHFLAIRVAENIEPK